MKVLRTFVRFVAAVSLLCGQTLAQSAGLGESSPSVAGLPQTSARASAFLGQSPLAGSVPAGPATDAEIPLSLTEAVQRGLKANLAAVLTDAGRLAAEGGLWRSRVGLLPSVDVQASGISEQINLKALGFRGFPGIPTIVGPFGVVDLRARLSQPVLNFPAIYAHRAANENLRAAGRSYDDARDSVVLAVASLYLEAVAAAGRVAAAQAQVETAQALYDQAVDLKKAGVAPGIDVLRAEVQLRVQQQRLIVARSERDKQKFVLARAIGLPVGQRFRLTDQEAESGTVVLSLPEALAEAYRARADYQAAQARLRAAELSRKAADAERLPSLAFHADYGTIGPGATDSHGTFTVAARLTVPIFHGGRTKGDRMEAEALLRQRRAEVDDFRNRIELEVRSTLLDVQSAHDRVEVATRALDLAKQQLEQARDRFAAGVANNLEVVQAQAAVADAEESRISSLFAFNVSKSTLARALGQAEKNLDRFVLGRNR